MTSEQTFIKITVARNDDQLIITIPSGMQFGCVDQAIHHVTRGKPRDTFVKVVDWRGDECAIPACRMTPGAFPWEHHGFTHGSVERLTNGLLAESLVRS